MTYLTKRFRKIARKHEGFRKGENFPRTVSTSDICDRCGKVLHFMRECSMDKLENKEYHRLRGEKDKEVTCSLIKIQGMLHLTML